MLKSLMGFAVGWKGYALAAFAAAVIGAYSAYTIQNWRWRADVAALEKSHKQAKDNAVSAITNQCNVRIKADADKCQKQQKDFMAIRGNAHAMSQRVQAECGTLRNPASGTDTTASRYRLYGADGFFLIEFAARCAENLAACKSR